VRKTTYFIVLGVAAALLGTPAEAQLINEGFEDPTFPPAGWAAFRGVDDVGTLYDWERATTSPNTGVGYAFVRYENVTSGIAEDWLVTPQLFPDATDSTLSFWMRQAYTPDWGTTFTVRVSTASQTTHADFTVVQTWVETDFDTTYAEFTVDLSAYSGQAIYVAFVMAQDDGDSWYIDDVTGVPVPVELMSFQVE